MEECKQMFSKNVISQVPNLAIYIPNFITEEEEEEIMTRVNVSPRPKWTQLSCRRLQNWGGIPHPKGMIAEEIPSWLKKYIVKVSSCNVFEKGKLPNHVLINEYLPGQGIMAHSDGPLFHPVVMTISCGSHTLIDFYKRLDTAEKHQTNLEFSILLERKSLFILLGELYHDYLHSIAARDVDDISTAKIRNLDICEKKFSDGERLKRNTRLSLTIRHVPKTSKLKLSFGIIEQLGGRQRVMQLLAHEDPNVRYEALLAVQKHMVYNWEYLGKQLEKEQTGTTGAPETKSGAQVPAKA